MADQQYFYGTGRRKTAVARVRLYPGNGAVVINGKPLEEIFGRDIHIAEALSPLRRLGRETRFSAQIKCAGGGITGWLEPSRWASPAPSSHPTLRSSPLLSAAKISSRETRARRSAKSPASSAPARLRSSRSANRARSPILTRPPGRVRWFEGHLGSASCHLGSISDRK